ncbi:hypothetical protein C6560_11530 [Enterobacter sp. FS01]|nr:hypothetical protein C6560_11530 [Enterobacter sp. FS01]
MPGGATLTGPVTSAPTRRPGKAKPPPGKQTAQACLPGIRTPYFFRVHAICQWEPTPGSYWLAAGLYWTQ